MSCRPSLALRFCCLIVLDPLLGLFVPPSSFPYFSVHTPFCFQFSFVFRCACLVARSRLGVDTCN